MELPRATPIGLSIRTEEALQLPLVERPRRVLMEAFQEKAFRARPETAKKRKLRQHSAIAAGEIGQQASLLQDVAGDNAEHKRAPAGVRHYLPEPSERDGTVADVWAVGLLTDSGLGIDVASCVAVERKQISFVVNERGVAVRENCI